MQCIIASAKDQRRAPDVSLGDVPTIGDLLRRLFLFITSLIICFGPSVVYLIVYWRPLDFIGWRTDIMCWFLYGLGLFLMPMFMLAIAMFDSITALNPILIIGSIASTFLPYCGLAVIFGAIGVITTQVPIRMLAYNWLLMGLNLYLFFVVAYLLGRFYLRYEDKLNWEIGL